MNNVREFHWITDEKEWGIILYQVPVALFSIELYGKTSWISLRITTTVLP